MKESRVEKTEIHSKCGHHKHHLENQGKTTYHAIVDSLNKIQNVKVRFEDLPVHFCNNTVLTKDFHKVVVFVDVDGGETSHMNTVY